MVLDRKEDIEIFNPKTGKTEKLISEKTSTKYFGKGNKEIADKKEALAAIDETSSGRKFYYLPFTRNHMLYVYVGQFDRPELTFKKVGKACYDFYVQFLITGKRQFLTRAERETINNVT